MHALLIPRLFRPCLSRRTALLLTMLAALTLFVAGYANAVDLVNPASIGGALTSPLTTISGLTDGMKALAGILAFFVTLITIVIARHFGAVYAFGGLAIFGATGLAVGGTVMAAVI